MIFNKEIAGKLKTKYDGLKPMYQEMLNYYKGKTKIDTAYPYANFGENNKAKINYIKKFICEHVAYGVGVPIQYTHVNDIKDCITKIEKNIQIQKSSLDTIFMKNMLIFGKAFEIAYVYKDKDGNQELRFKVSNPYNSIAYCNEEGEVEMFLYFYYKELEDDLYIDCYCDDGIRHFKNDFDTQIGSIEEALLGVPVSVAQLDDDIFGTLFKDIKELQDALELVMSNWVNNDSDFRDCYFKAKNLSIDADFIEKANKLKVFELPNDTADIDFMTKEVNPEYVHKLVEKIQDYIYQVSQSINSNENLQSNLSGVAILSRIINLRNKIGLEQKCLADAIKNRLRLLFKYLNKIDNTDYDYRDIMINFTMNVPQDDVSMAQIISQLGDKLSAETGLNQLSFVKNGRKEFERKLAEDKEIAENQAPPKLNYGDQHSHDGGETNAI